MYFLDAQLLVVYTIFVASVEASLLRRSDRRRRVPRADCNFASSVVACRRGALSCVLVLLVVHTSAYIRSSLAPFRAVLFPGNKADQAIQTPRE
jgi:hypothetical protein